MRCSRTEVFNTGASAPYVWPRARTLFCCYVDAIGAGLAFSKLC